LFASSKSVYGIGVSNAKEIKTFLFDSTGSVSQEKQFLSDSSFLLPITVNNRGLLCMETSNKLFFGDLKSNFSDHFDIKVRRGGQFALCFFSIFLFDFLTNKHNTSTVPFPIITCSSPSSAQCGQWSCSSTGSHALYHSPV
jgi:hypothetical protein